MALRNADLETGALGRDIKGRKRDFLSEGQEIRMESMVSEMKQWQET